MGMWANYDQWRTSTPEDIDYDCKNCIHNSLADGCEEPSGSCEDFSCYEEREIK